jgi:hypothetical protein
MFALFSLEAPDPVPGAFFYVGGIPVVGVFGGIPVVGV